jgi:hypothetical protein
MMVLKIRDKVQKYPNKPLNDALMNKLKENDNGDKTLSIGL